MSSSNRLLISLSLTYLLVLFTMTSAAAQAQITEKEVIQKLDQIRAIRATSDKQLLDKFNSQLDDAWTFFNDNKEYILPILANELSIEGKKTKPNDFLLMDIGYFLYLEGDEDKRYKEVAKQALYTLNPKDEVVAANQQQLFYFVHKVAADKDPEILDFIDKAFLYDQETSIYIPQHAMKLDPTLICVFLYGVFGEDSEDHLRLLLNDPTITNKVIELLIWIGSDSSVEDVFNAMTNQRNHRTFIRALAFMIQSGGSVGREFILQIDVQNLEKESLQYYNKVKSSVNDVSFELMKDVFSGFPGDSTLPNEEIKLRLSEMYKNYGKDDETNPMAILLSNLPKEFLIGELLKIRSRMLYRISDEALSDVKITNVLINALQYRTK